MTSPEAMKALRSLLLPMNATAETEYECASVLESILKRRGVISDDYQDWISYNLDLWEESGDPSKEFGTTIRSVLAVAGDSASETLAENYFAIHKKLCEEFFFTHSQARLFLSHSFMILEMARREKLSAAQIARMMAVRDARVDFNRHTVSMFLGRLRIKPAIQQKEVEETFKLDGIEEAEFFADASLEDGAHMLGVIATSLGYIGNLADQLKTLTPQDNIGKHGPYLQILHYQCTIAEYFDHAVTDFYEFSPRGQAFSLLLDKYPPVLKEAANPFLNNAKSAERADAGWVRMKKITERRGATALQGVLEGLETMGFAARRELARLIRLWLHRVIRFSKPFEIILPPKLTEAQWNAVLDSVKESNTSTFGIIEQRVVDAVSWAQHLNGWRARGIGAAVNATNISSRRLGDCDYQSAEKREIHAYESHGGILTDVYLNEHLRTLRKSFDLRKEELQGIAELTEWKIYIKFIAHEIRVKDPQPMEIDGVIFRISLESFNSFIRNWRLTSANFDDLDRFIIAPLCEKRTPMEARKRLLELAGLNY